MRYNFYILTIKKGYEDTVTALPNVPCLTDGDTNYYFFRHSRGFLANQRLNRYAKFYGDGCYSGLLPENILKQVQSHCPDTKTIKT